VLPRRFRQLLDSVASIVSRVVCGIRSSRSTNRSTQLGHRFVDGDVVTFAGASILDLDDTVGKAGDPQLPAAERLAQDCEAAGLRVLLDDRVGVSPGIKFNDAELIGVPTIIIVGRGLADGVVEVKDRRSGERHDVTIDKAVSELRTAIR